MMDQKAYKRAAWVMLISTVLYLLSNVSAYFLSGVIAGDLTRQYAFNALMVSIISIFVPAMIFRRTTGKNVCASRRVNFAACVLGIVLGIGMFFLVSGIATAMQYLFKALGLAVRSTSSTLPGTNGWNFLISVLLVAVIPAITEETLFRGALLPAWRTMGRKKAVLLTGVLFALLHCQPTNFVGLVLHGIVLGLVAYESGSLVPSILMHVTNNTLVLVMSHLQNNASAAEVAAAAEATTGDIAILCVAFIVGGAIVSFFAYRMLMRSIVHEPAPERVTEKPKGIALPLAISCVLLGVLNIVTIYSLLQAA